MPKTRLPRACLAAFALLLVCALAPALADDPKPAAPAGAEKPGAYETRPASADGIGKFYMGREIAQVMGHQGADWLERPEREAEEQPQKLVEMMALRPADVVADIGAGTGYFSFRMAAKVPIAPPTISPKTTEKKANSTVTGSRRRISSSTGTCSRRDCPKSPRTACPSHLTYCTGSG